jgi:hypothetical protein
MTERGDDSSYKAASFVGFVCFIAVVLTTSPITAQTFVGVGVTGSFQWGQDFGLVNPNLPSHGIGGSTLGLTFDAGGAIAKRIGWAVNFTKPRALSYAQEASTHRDRGTFADVTLSGLVALEVQNFVVLGGLSWVQEQLTRATVFTNGSGFPPFPGFGDRTNVSALAATTGVEFHVRRGRLVEVVPQLLVSFVKRPNEDYSLGLGRMLVRPGLSVRFNLSE